MTIDLDALEATTKAATPGPWDVYGDSNIEGWEIEADYAYTKIVRGNVCKEEDADFIAAANPAVVLELVAEVRRQRKTMQRLARALRWTTETPTEPGWYWNRVAGKETLPMRLYYDSDGEFCYQVAGLPNDCWLVEDLADEVGCEWAGPIPEPEEPQR